MHPQPGSSSESGGGQDALHALGHALKQPLSVAAGFVELLLDDPSCELAASTVRYACEIQLSLQTMHQIIDRHQPAAEQ